MVDPKAEICSKQVSAIAQELHKGYFGRAGSRILALLQLLENLDVFQGWASEAACFLVLCGKRAEQEEVCEPFLKLVGKVAEAVSQQVDEVGIEQVWHGMTSIVEDVERVVAKSSTPGFWPVKLRTFMRYVEEKHAEGGDSEGFLTSLGSLREAHLGKVSEAVGLARAGAAFLRVLVRQQGFRALEKSTLLGLARLVRWHKQDLGGGGGAFLGTIVEGLRCNWCLPDKGTLHEIRRTVLERLQIMGLCGIQSDFGFQMTPSEEALCEIVDILGNISCDGDSEWLAESILIALKGIPWNSKLWSNLFDIFLRGLNNCTSPHTAHSLLRKFVEEHNPGARVSTQIRTLTALVSRMHDIWTHNIGDFIVMKVMAWMMKGLDELMSLEDLQSLGVLLVEFVPLVLVNDLFVPPKYDLQEQLCKLLDKISNLHPNEPIQVQALLLDVCLDCLRNAHMDPQVQGKSILRCEDLLQENAPVDAQAIAVSLLPFANLFFGSTAQDCTVRLVTYCATNHSLIKEAVAQALGFLGVAYGSRTGERELSAAVGNACAHITRWALRQTSKFYYPDCGSVSICFGTLDPFCDMMLTDSNSKHTQAVLSSMAMILNRIEERGILGAKHLLDKILRCICLSGHCQEKKNLLKGFCRPCVLEEWGGLSNLDAEKKLIQEIRRHCASSRQATQLLESLYPHLSVKENVMLLAAALMVSYASSNCAQALKALKMIAADEGTSLHDFVMGDHKEHFGVLFTEHPDVMDAVSAALELPPTKIPMAYLGYTLQMCWRSSNPDIHGSNALGHILRRLGPNWKEVFIAEFQSAFVLAVWRAEKNSVEKLVEIAQQVSGIQHGEWIDMLVNKLESLAEETILASGDEVNWLNGNTSVDVASRCWFCLQIVAEACCIPELEMKRMLIQPIFINKILAAHNYKLSLKSNEVDRLCSWRTLVILIRRMKEDKVLMRYSPHLLAVIRAGLKTEEGNRAAVEGLNALELVMDAEMLEVAREHTQISQEIVVALAPTLRMEGDAFKAGYCLLEKLVSQCTKVTMKRIAAITFNIRHSNDRDSRIALVFKDLQSTGFFATSGTSCPLFTELCSCLASDSSPILLESLHSMRLFLRENAAWVKRLACSSAGDAKVHNLQSVTQALQSLLVCLGRTRRSEEGRTMNSLCSRCLGMIGAIDPQLVSMKTLLPLKIPESEVSLVATLTEHLVRVLFSADLQTVEAASHALGQVLEILMHRDEHLLSCLIPSSLLSLLSQCKITKPENASGRRLDGISVQSVIQDSGIISHWVFSSPASIEIVAEPVDSGALTSIEDLTVRHWLLNWLFYLESEACGSLAPVLKLVVAAQKCDMPSMMCLFPYLLHNVITEGKPEAQDVIVQGLLTVIQETNTVARQQAQRIDTQKCQMVFLLLDCLRQWATRPSAGERKAKKVHEVLGRIDRKKLAEAAFHCGGYTRALQYMEAQLLQEKKGGLNPSAARSASFSDEEVTFLMQIYSQLDDPDGLTGLVRLRAGGLSTLNRITVAEQQGNWDHAISLWESVTSARRFITPKTGDVSNQSGVVSSSDQIVPGQNQRGQLRCMLRAGRLEMALDKATTLMASSAYEAGTMAQVAAGAVEACWKLGQWKELGHALSKVSESSADQSASGSQLWVLSPDEDWNLRIGKILYILQQPQTTESLAVAFEEQFVKAQEAVMRLLPGRAAESYEQCYPFLMKLQMLEEVDYVFSILKAGAQINKPSGHNLYWDSRVNAADNSPEMQESLLYLRRQLAVILEDPILEQEQFLEMARASRKAGSARMAIAAWHMKLPSSALEYIKSMWSAGNHELAIEELETEINHLKSGGSIGQLHRITGQRYRAKLVLLLARLKTGRDSQQELRRTFEEARVNDAQWSKPCMCFAQYLDGLYQDAQIESGAQVATDRKDRLQGRSRLRQETEEHFTRMLPQIFQNYAKASCLSSKHAQDCLSRILTLYFEFGDSASKRSIVLPESVESLIHRTMLKVQQEVPSSQWYLVLPQLVSRICHPWPKVQGWIEKTLTLVADDFPHHTLWSLAFATSSGIKDRKATAKRIVGALGESKNCNSRGRAMASAFIAFADELMKLCMATLPANTDEIDGLQNFPRLFGLFGKLPYGIIVPVQKFIRGSVAPVNWSDRSLSPSAGVPTITGMKPGIKILQSLMKPRKIVFIGSDGKDYPFLAKPKDDLRKDFRLMEFCSVLNHYFKKNTQARKRKLGLRTFMVLPLKEDCGILEWVDGLVSLRALCESTYRLEEGSYPRKKYFVTMHEKEGWLNLVLNDLKPCLHKCFLRAFPTPDKWLSARLSFTRTTAAWSMVGHTVGLGDRHTENVNLDTISGNAVHVDFGCLFDQGLTLAVPEVTPFRLTQNIVDAFGVSGVEGVFMNSAGIVLKVLREHREPLLTCLKSFLHDPLVKWVESKSSVEVENPYAKDAILTIEGRLLGKLIGVKSERSSTLSCEGHADALVREATSHTNLANMYVWWMPWL